MMAEPSMTLLNTRRISDDMCTNFTFEANVLSVTKKIAVATAPSYIFIKLTKTHGATEFYLSVLFMTQEKKYTHVYMRKVGLASPLPLFYNVK